MIAKFVTKFVVYSTKNKHVIVVKIASNKKMIPKNTSCKV